MKTIVLVGWEKYQHYKDRDPPWVKVHRQILTSESWVLGTDASRLVQLASILLAARYQNATPLDWNLIRKVSGLDMKEADFILAIQHLEANKFLEINDVADCKQNASSVLAKCYSEERREEAEESNGRRVERDAPDEPEGFAEFKSVYPKRRGDQRWGSAKGAWRANVKRGVAPAEMVAGARRYAAYVVAAKVEPGYVKQAASFLGRDECWKESWDAGTMAGDDDWFDERGPG